MKHNPKIDLEKLRQYEEFLRKLERAGIDVNPGYKISRPLADPSVSPTKRPPRSQNALCRVGTGSVSRR